MEGIGMSGIDVKGLSIVRFGLLEASGAMVLECGLEGPRKGKRLPRTWVPA
jgi:hypothetical protein